MRQTHQIRAERRTLGSIDHRSVIDWGKLCGETCLYPLQAGTDNGTSDVMPLWPGLQQQIESLQLESIFRPQTLETKLFPFSLALYLMKILQQRHAMESMV